MWVLGHVFATRGLPVFHDVDVTAGEGLYGLMFVDLVNCHQWGYAGCWEVPDTVIGRLIKAHIIADAVVHLGREWTVPNKKVGWVYRRMALLAAHYDRFFARAAADGMLTDPGHSHRESVRGWAHTMVEYAIDQYLCDRKEVGDAFAAVRRTFAAADARLDGALGTLRDLGIDTKTPFPEQPRQYARTLAGAAEPDQLHLRGLTVKFGLRDSAEVWDWLRSILRNVIAAVGHDEIEAVVAEVRGVLSDPHAYRYPVTWPSAGLARADAR